jgi:hypothetical protein
MTAKREVPILQIGGVDGPHTKAVLAILEKVAVAATANGREAVAVEAIRALSDIGSVKNVTIQNCTLDGSVTNRRGQF